MARVLAVGLLGLVGGCSTIDPAFVPPDDNDRYTEPASCQTLFGRPSRLTGLGPDVCMPKVDCEEIGVVDWIAPVYTEDDIEEMRAWTLVELPEGRSVAPGVYFEPRKLDRDPYEHQDRWLGDPARDDRYCGVLPLTEGAGEYVLVTYDSEEDARAAGAFITHQRACGLCSTLQDLAIYAAYNDLTDPVRSCGLTAFGDYELSRLACIASIGFTAPCAQIWAFNTAHTQDVCGVTCLSELDNHFNTPDGNLNPCLYCDEIRSGPIFKAVAGRTRRSSGLPNAICRPVTEGDGVYPVEHRYPPRTP